MNIDCIYILQLCANWLDFYDPDSGITSYKYGIGSEPGKYDVAGLIDISYTKYEACITLDSDNLLQHGETYYNLIWASNGGINQRNISEVSNGGKFIAIYHMTLPLGVI